MEIYIMLQGCSKLAQKEYKRRHDNFKMYNSKIVHWKLARKCNFEAGNKQHEHEPESVLQNEHYKILSDFSVQTDDVIETCKIINFVVPGDSKIKGKDIEKTEK